MARSPTQTGVPYVYRHREKGYKAIVWNPHFRALVFLGVFKTIAGARACARRAMQRLGTTPGIQQPRPTCKRGHVQVGQNVTVTTRHGRTRRKCAVCEKARQHDYHVQRQATKHQTRHSEEHSL